MSKKIKMTKKKYDLYHMNEITRTRQKQAK
jgi:hypothetical protein